MKTEQFKGAFITPRVGGKGVVSYSIELSTYSYDDEQNRRVIRGTTERSALKTVRFRNVNVV